MIQTVAMIVHSEIFQLSSTSILVRSVLTIYKQEYYTICRNVRLSSSASATRFLAVFLHIFTICLMSTVIPISPGRTFRIFVHAVLFCNYKD